jgi:hypothetical protein
MSIASSILGGFITVLTTVHRGAAPTWSGGHVTPGAVSTVSVLAAIFPAPNTDLVRGEEGRRRTDLIDVYTSDVLYSGRDTGEPADLIDWGGSTYEVEDVDTWPGGLYQARARRRTA